MSISYRISGPFTTQRTVKATVPWQGGLKFKTYNPGKVTQKGPLVGMVCEAVLGYVCTMKTCAAKGQKLETQFYLFVNHELTNVILNIVKMAK